MGANLSVPDRIKAKSMVSRRGAGTQGKARIKEGVSRNGATHATKKQKNNLAQRRRGAENDGGRTLTKYDVGSTIGIAIGGTTNVKGSKNHPDF
jgi:hypothetical protein